jgi:hypothetical protein
MFVGEDDLHWVICLNHDWVNNHMSDIISIPKGMIEYVEVLSKAEPIPEIREEETEEVTRKRIK